MNNQGRFIIQGELGDGRPGYFRWAGSVPEWDADQERARVYKRRAAAEEITERFGGVVVQLRAANAKPTYAELEAEVARLRAICREVAGWLHDGTHGEWIDEGQESELFVITLPRDDYEDLVQAVQP